MPWGLHWLCDAYASDWKHHLYLEESQQETCDILNVKGRVECTNYYERQELPLKHHQNAS